MMEYVRVKLNPGLPWQNLDTSGSRSEIHGKDEEEDIRNYWMTLRTGEDTLI
jgi:hypothetical protein